jgi:membrane-associated phospholipid phosphatase
MRWCAGLLLLCGVATSAHADELRFDPLRDGAITLGLGAALVLDGAWLGDELDPDSCRWCDASLNRLDARARGLRWENRDRAVALSNVAAYLLLPGAMAALVGGGASAERRPETWTDFALVLEAVAATEVATRIAKHAAARRRPFARAGDAGADDELGVDANHSFVSGHSSVAFALAVSSGTIASLRGRRSAKVIWSIGLSAAAATAYLRVAADVHYATDVLAGAAVGAAIGVAVPWLARSGRAPRLSLARWGHGLVVTGEL